MALEFHSQTVAPHDIEPVTYSFGGTVLSATALIQSIDLSYSGNNHPIKRIIADIDNLTYSGNTVSCEVQVTVKDKSSNYMSGNLTVLIVAVTA